MKRISTCLLLLIWAQQGLSQERPNILFVYTDNQSHRTVGCYAESFDWVRTPNIKLRSDTIDELKRTDAGLVDHLPTVGTAVRQEPLLKPGVSNVPWIIDTHTHFKGVEQIELESRTRKWHPKNTLGHVVQPEDFRAIADRTGIQSTMVVEAVEQNHPQFNDWLLAQAKSDLVCGYVARGNLESDEFVENYNRYKKSGYLKGFRFRNDELHGYLAIDAALEHLKMLERDGMVVDLMVSHQHSKDVIQLAQQFPRLKIVVNHCFRVKTQDGQPSDEWKAAVIACAKYPNVFCKLSSILNFAGTKPFTESAPTDHKIYGIVLQLCFESFGEDRVIFGTNWAVCTHFGNVDDVVRIVSEFLKTKGDDALRKGMRDNAIRVYGISKKHLR